MTRYRTYALLAAGLAAFWYAVGALVLSLFR